MDNSWHVAAMQELFIPARNLRHDSRRQLAGEVGMQIQGQEGRLKVSINNLKALFPLEASSTLHFFQTWLLNQDRGITASIGVFNSDDNGNAVSFFEFSPHNVLDTGLNIAQFDSIAITVEVKDRMISPEMGTVILFGELPQDLGYLPEGDSYDPDDWGRWRSQSQDNWSSSETVGAQRTPPDELFVKDDFDLPGEWPPENLQTKAPISPGEANDDIEDDT